MFGKKDNDAAKEDKKKRKFLTKKFAASTKGLPFFGGASSLFLVPLAMVDGGVTLAMAAFMASLGVGFPLLDSGMQKDTIHKTRCGQRVFTQKWAGKLQSELQTKIIKTYTELNFVTEGSKRQKKLLKRKSDLLEVARDLEDLMTVIDSNNNPTNLAVEYYTKAPGQNAEQNKKFIIRPGQDKRASASQPKPQQGV